MASPILAGGRPRGIPGGFLAVAAAVLLLLIVTGGVSLWLLLSLRDAEREQRATQATGLVGTLAENARRQIDAADLLLQFTAAEISERVHRRLAPSEALGTLLSQRVSRVTQIRAVHIYNETGQLWFLAGNAPMPLDVSWHPGFRLHREGLAMQVAAGEGANAARLWLSRRIDLPDQGFGGIMVASLDIEVDQLIDKDYVTVPVQVVALVHGEGRLIIGWPDDAANQVAGLTNFIDHRPLGSAETSDGPVYWARIADFPVNVLLRVAPADAEGEWQRVAAGFGLLLTVLTAGAVAALWSAWRQLRRRAASEALLRGMMDNPPIVMALLAPDGRYLMANRFYCDLLGKTEQELIGRHADEIFPRHIADQYNRQISDTVSAGRPLLFDMRSHDLAGVLRHYALVRFPIYGGDGNLLAIGGIALDITERKQLEEALREQAAERETLAENYARQRETAETANRAKSEFMAHMSHELRTPLNAVIGFADMIAGQVLGTQSPKYFEYAEDISRSAHHLLGVINDILDVSKIESGRFELEPGQHDLRGLVEDGIRLVQGRARESNVRLANRIATDLPPIVVDARAVKQILINLLVNAVKFTPAGGLVAVDGSVTQDGSVRLLVSDTGSGIAAEHLPRLFEPFWQANAGVRRSEGSGLGLSICRKLIELHGGSISIASEPGHGTQVTVNFPPGTAVCQAAQ